MISGNKEFYASLFDGCLTSFCFLLSSLVSLVENASKTGINSLSVQVNLKPKVPTKAVCAEHLELRKEILTLLNLQKQVPSYYNCILGFISSYYVDLFTVFPNISSSTRRRRVHLIVMAHMLILQERLRFGINRTA